MPAPCSLDLRKRAVAAYESGEGTYTELGARFGIHEHTLLEWVMLKRETGSVAPRPRGGGVPPKVMGKVLSKIVGRHPDGTSFEITSKYNRSVKRGERVHRSSILRALHRLGLVYKKNGTAPRSRTVLMSNERERPS
jgi:transposase